MHLSDEQLNEYLDNETDDRAQIELHLAACAECSTRLFVLQELFHEIESLPELNISPEFAARFAPSQNLSLWPLRALVLTVTLQVALAAVAMIVAAPFVMQFLSHYASGIPAPSFGELFLQIQRQWAAWLDMLSTFQVPSIPTLPVLEISGLMLTLALLSASLLWLIGNGLLLRSQMK
jgi:hypothetical protein